ncbi:unnamed protein product [Knipowitschia caucasica]
MLVLLAPPGLEPERPQRLGGKTKEASSGSESPLCTPGSTPSALTPDFSPISPSSPLKHRPRRTCIHRQSAMDDQAEIQVLVEGRGLELQRGGTKHTWAEDRCSSRSTTPSLLEEAELNGHQANHKPPDPTPTSNHTPRDYHSLSNHTTREYSSSNHRTWDHSYRPQLHALANHTGPEHALPNHKAAEHVTSNHHRKDYGSTNHSAREHGNHKPQHKHRGPAHKDHYTVDMCPSASEPQSPCLSRLRPRLRPVREASVDSVQRLDRLSTGAEPEAREAGPAEGEEPEPWPLNRDVTLSTPLRSPPIIDLEAEPESRKVHSTGSSSFLVVMVILLNIGVAVLFIHFFI